MPEIRAPKRSLRAVPKLSFLRQQPSATDIPTLSHRGWSRGARILLGAGATGLFAALIIASFSASGVIDMTLAIALLGVAWIVGVGAVLVSEPLLGLQPRIRWPAAAIVSIALAAAIVGLGFYENAHFPAEK